MILDIKSNDKYIGLLNCFEYPIQLFADISGLSCFMIYAEAWRFPFSIINAQKENKLYAGFQNYQYDPHKYLKDYHGIYICNSEKKELDEVIDILIKELEAGRPMLAKLDPFWLPFTSIYQKTHDPNHIALVHGYDPINNLFYIADGISRVIERNNFNCAYGGHSTFRIQDQNIKSFNWQEVVMDAIVLLFDRINRGSDFKAMIDFADLLSNSQYSDFINADFTHFDELNFFFKLTEIRNGRILFSKFIDEIITLYKVEYLRQISMKIMKLGKSWDMIRNMIIKAYYKDFPQEILNEVSQKIYGIAKLEEDTAYKLLAIVKKYM